MTKRGASSGVTLIEMLVALSIFSLIGLASFAVLDTIVRTDRQSKGRLDALARIETAFRLFEVDLLRARGTPSVSPDRVSLLSGDHRVTYAQKPGGVIRIIEREDLDPFEQQVLPAPAMASWHLVAGARDDATGPRDAIEFVLLPEGDREATLRKLVPLPPKAPDGQ